MANDALPVLAQLSLVVVDMAASVAFYRRLGLVIDDTGPWAAHHPDVRMQNGFVLDDTFWGARYAVVEDPDQNPVGLMSPLDPARRSAPPTM